MSTINVTLITLCKDYPVLTKKGVVWKNRIDWTRIEVKGNRIVTHFGTFTFIASERIDKVWYWTLQDDEGNVFKIKRDQARRNKKMPKNAQIVEVEIDEPEQPTTSAWDDIIDTAIDYFGFNPTLTFM